MDNEMRLWPTAGKTWESEDLVIGYSSPIGGLDIEAKSPSDVLTIYQGNWTAVTGYVGDRPRKVDFETGEITFTQSGAESTCVTEYFPDILYIASTTGFHHRLVNSLNGDKLLEDTSSRATKLSQRLELSRMVTQFLDSDGFGGKIKAEALTCLIVAEMLQAQSGKTIEHPKCGLSPHALRRVKEYIHEHTDCDLSLEGLAELAGVSTFHFSRMFKQDTGVSPHQYVIQSRVEHAKQLLASEKFTIADISCKSGFSSQSHMTQNFKRIVGATPARYQKLRYS